MGNNQGSIHLHTFNASENIAKSFRGYFFDSHCIYMYLKIFAVVTIPCAYYLWSIEIVSLLLHVIRYFSFYRATACNATHGIATRKLSVRPSVCPSVCQTRGLWQNESSVHFLIPHERSFSLVVWQEEWLVGGGGWEGVEGRPHVLESVSESLSQSLWVWEYVSQSHTRSLSLNLRLSLSLVSQRLSLNPRKSLWVRVGGVGRNWRRVFLLFFPPVPPPFLFFSPSPLLPFPFPGISIPSFPPFPVLPLPLPLPFLPPIMSLFLPSL